MYIFKNQYFCHAPVIKSHFARERTQYTLTDIRSQRINLGWISDIFYIFFFWSLVNKLSLIRLIIVNNLLFLFISSQFVVVYSLFFHIEISIILLYKIAYFHLRIVISLKVRKNYIYIYIVKLVTRNFVNCFFSKLVNKTRKSVRCYKRVKWNEFKIVERAFKTDKRRNVKKSVFVFATLSTFDVTRIAATETP